MTKHIYENKGVRLYYETPENYSEVIQMCRTLGIQPEHWQDCRKLLSSLLHDTLTKINITTVDFDGGWKG